MGSLGDVVDVTEVQHKPLREPNEQEDLFLVNEGLAFLAAYRSISDVDMRMAIKGLIEAVARTFNKVGPSG